MDRLLLNPKNYTFAGDASITRNGDLDLSRVDLSATMLVKWKIRQMVKGATIEQIGSLSFLAYLEIPTLARLEEDYFDINPSMQGRERGKIINLDPSLPYKFEINRFSSLVTNSSLEFYTLNIMPGSFNNPISIAPTDMTPVINAIANSAAATVAATQQAAAQANPKIAAMPESSYTAIAWTGDPKKHIAVPVDNLLRTGGTIYNNGSKRVWVDRFVDISTKSATPQQDGYIDPGGTFNITAADANAGVLLYTIPTGTGTAANTTSECLISLELKAAPPVSTP